MEQICMVHDESLVKLREDSAANEREHESFRRRLKEHDAKIEQMSDLMLAIQKQGAAIESMAKTLNEVKKSVDKVDERVGDLEQEPADKWKKITWEIVKYVVLAVIGLVVGYFLKG